MGENQRWRNLLWSPGRRGRRRKRGIWYHVTAAEDGRQSFTCFGQGSPLSEQGFCEQAAAQPRTACLLSERGCCEQSATPVGDRLSAMALWCRHPKRHPGLAPCSQLSAVAGNQIALWCFLPHSATQIFSSLFFFLFFFGKKKSVVYMPKIQYLSL